MKIMVEINMDNAAFDAPPDSPGIEVARILRKACDRIERDAPYPFEWESALADSNGNRVGCITIVQE